MFHRNKGFVCSLAVQLPGVTAERWPSTSHPEFPLSHTVSVRAHTSLRTRGHQLCRHFSPETQMTQIHHSEHKSP